MYEKELRLNLFINKCMKVFAEKIYEDSDRVRDIDIEWDIMERYSIDIYNFKEDNREAVLFEINQWTTILDTIYVIVSSLGLDIKPVDNTDYMYVITRRQ